MLRVTLEIVVCIFDTFDNNLEIKNCFTKYLNESWLYYCDEHLTLDKIIDLTLELRNGCACPSKGICIMDFRNLELGITIISLFLPYLG